jgi:hypothetical protein
MEVREDATLSGICCNTVLVLLPLLNNFGDFGRDTWFCDWNGRWGRDLGYGWDLCEISILEIKDFPSSCEDYCGKLNRLLKISKQRRICWCHIGFLFDRSLNEIWSKTVQLMDVRPLWNSSLHLPEITAKYSQASPSRVVTVWKHSCSDWKIRKECDVKPRTK